MTAGELRALLATVDPDVEVLVRWNDDECCHVACVASATVEFGCTESAALMIDADTDEGDGDG